MHKQPLDVVTIAMDMVHVILPVVHRLTSVHVMTVGVQIQI
jgi:hypothetical protein